MWSVDILVGMATQLAPLYLTEISPFNLRGMFGTANQLFITLGLFTGSVFGLREILGRVLLLYNKSNFFSAQKSVNRERVPRRAMTVSLAKLASARR